MGLLDSTVDSGVTWLKRLGAAALAGMMTMTVFDVITRAIGVPIFGAVEFVSFMATLVLACSMPLTHVENGHVGVDLLVRRFQPKTQNIIDGVTNVLSGLLFFAVTWQMFEYGAALKKSGEVSMSLEVPFFYLVYAVATAFGILTLVVFRDALSKFSKAVGS